MSVKTTKKVFQKKLTKFI